MEIPVPSLATVEAAWNWALKNLQVWFRVLSNPASVLSDTDLDTTDSTLAAVQFSIFPIALSVLLDLPIYIVRNEVTVGVVGFVAIDFITDYITMFIYAVSQRVSAKMFFGKGKFNACLVATLYAQAFSPLGSLRINRISGLVRLMSEGGTTR
jgi:hypothetical protein